MDRHHQADATKASPHEETWEEANFSTDFTPYTSRRIQLYYPSLSPIRSFKNPVSAHAKASCIDIRSVDTSGMTLLDVCNYMPQPNVDGSGHCVWMGAMYFIHALSIGLAFSEVEGDITDTNSTGTKEGLSNDCWYNMFQQKRVAELGCGTGAAGIALLKLLHLKSSPLSLKSSSMEPREFHFWDNDPEALDLCQQNCENSINSIEAKYQLDPGWKLDSEISTKGEDVISKSFDTIFATDVLYDLKIIRPFLETASRMLASNSSTTTINALGNETTQNEKDKEAEKYLILSHIPRWYLPRDGTSSSSKPAGDQARRLETHIVHEASECKFSLRHTVRPREILSQYQMLVNSRKNGDGYKSKNNTTHSDLIEELRDMDQADAVLWVFSRRDNDVEESVRS